MPHVNFSLIGTGFILAVCLAALALGDRRARIAGALFLLAAAATLAAQPLSGRLDPVGAFLGIDLVVWLGLLALSWRSASLWPFAATAAQGIAMAAHLIRLVRPATPSWTYITVISITSDAAVLALAFGTWEAWRARRLHRETPRALGGRS